MTTSDKREPDKELPPWVPPFDDEPVYNLSEAVELIGRTTGLFYSPKNKAALEELGVQTGGKGGWRIPQSALVHMGWLTDDGMPTRQKAHKGQKFTVEFQDLPEGDPFAMMTLSKEELVRQVMRLSAELETSERLRWSAEKDNERISKQFDELLSRMSG